MLHGKFCHERSRFNALILQCADGRRTLYGILERVRCRNRLIESHTLIGARAPGHHGLDVSRINHNGLGKNRLGVGSKRLPVARSRFKLILIKVEPVRAHPLARLFVRGDNRPARSGFHREITKRHALFNAQCLDARALVLDDATERSAGSDCSQDIKGQILGR